MELLTVEFDVPYRSQLFGDDCGDREGVAGHTAEFDDGDVLPSE